MHFTNTTPNCRWGWVGREWRGQRASLEGDPLERSRERGWALTGEVISCLEAAGQEMRVGRERKEGKSSQLRASTFFEKEEGVGGQLDQEPLQETEQETGRDPNSGSPR